MGQEYRPEISEKNKYYISKHRYYELKHFCLQYHEWEKQYNILEESTIQSQTLQFAIIHGELFPWPLPDPTHKLAMKKASLSSKMDMVKNTAMKVDSYLGEFIFKAVTEDKSYNYLRMKCNLACGKDIYYENLRRFFWELDKIRQ
jgi:hypothetical protein